MENAIKLLERFPELEHWLKNNHEKVIDNQLIWDDIIKVVQYFKNNQKPYLYVRELPIKVHTKFIEQNKPILKNLLDIILSENFDSSTSNFEKRYYLKTDESKVRIKILDQEISNTYLLGLSDITIPISQFNSLSLAIERVYILENKQNLETALCFPQQEKAIAIFGSGYKVGQLKNATWLSGKEIFYWGDIDAQGFEILSQVRGYFPQTKSIFMDNSTFEKFFEGDLGKPSKIENLSNLTQLENELYQKVRLNNYRLEQEKITHDYVMKAFD